MTDEFIQRNFGIFIAEVCIMLKNSLINLSKQAK